MKYIYYEFESDINDNKKKKKQERAIERLLPPHTTCVSVKVDRLGTSQIRIQTANILNHKLKYAQPANNTSAEEVTPHRPVQSKQTEVSIRVTHTPTVSLNMTLPGEGEEGREAGTERYHPLLSWGTEYLVSLLSPSTLRGTQIYSPFPSPSLFLGLPRAIFLSFFYCGLPRSTFFPPLSFSTVHSLFPLH